MLVTVWDLHDSCVAHNNRRNQHRVSLVEGVVERPQVQHHACTSNPACVRRASLYNNRTSFTIQLQHDGSLEAALDKLITLTMPSTCRVRYIIRLYTSCSLYHTSIYLVFAISYVYIPKIPSRERIYIPVDTFARTHTHTKYISIISRLFCAV